jgi:hypothetical protein
MAVFVFNDAGNPYARALTGTNGNGHPEVAVSQALPDH